MNVRDDICTRIRKIDPNMRPHLLVATCLYVGAKSLRPVTGWRYHYLARVVGLFAAAAAEVVRRLDPKDLHTLQFQADPCLNDFLTPSWDALVAEINKLEDAQRDGALHYVLAVIVKRSLSRPIGYPANGMGESEVNLAYAVFATAYQQFYDEVVAPYEDEAIKANGDVYA